MTAVSCWRDPLWSGDAKFTDDNLSEETLPELAVSAKVRQQASFT